MKKNIRAEFPMLQQKTTHGRELIYFNNAATTHKPQAVIDRLVRFYSQEYGTIYRGTYAASEKATALYESARATIATFIHASPKELIFTQGTTAGINFIATAWARAVLKPGDEIVISEMEHHANLIPWQQVAQHTGALVKFIPVKPDGTLDLTDLATIITPKTKLVAVVHVSNVLGTHNDMQRIGTAARSVGARFLIDAAQSVPHQRIDVQKLGCDFLVFSGHKMGGPTGIGVLYLRSTLHTEVPPYQFGGGMVFDAGFTSASWLDSPQKFEAGTPPIAQAIGLAAAVDYLEQNVDFDELKKREAQLCARAIDGLHTISSVRIAGPIDQLKTEGHLVTFSMDGFHAHDVAAYLDAHGISVRAGHHCAQPLSKKLALESSVRISFYCYNTIEEVEYFLAVLRELRKNGL